MMALLKMLILFGLFVHLAYASPVKPHSKDFTPRIVGGVEAPDNHSPHAMALVSGYYVNILMCGASIISECHVLTAAHCIEALMDWTGKISEKVYGVYGSNEWESTAKTVQFSGHVIHANYDPFMYKNDIGVMCLNRKLARSERWSIMPLNFDWIEAGHQSYVTGWGRLWDWGPIPARLQLIYLETLSEESCAEGVAAAVPEGWWIPPVDQSVEICTLHPKGEGFGVCNGDSGSALVSLESNTQTGIVSWGFPCARGAPDMFVRVSAFKDFLLDILKSCKCHIS